jgi:hypothetical protein
MMGCAFSGEIGSRIATDSQYNKIDPPKMAPLFPGAALFWHS